MLSGEKKKHSSSHPAVAVAISYRFQRRRPKQVAYATNAMWKSDPRSCLILHHLMQRSDGDNKKLTTLRLGRQLQLSTLSITVTGGSATHRKFARLGIRTHPHSWSEACLCFLFAHLPCLPATHLVPGALVLGVSSKTAAGYQNVHRKKEVK